MLGRATEDWRRKATSMTVAASGQPARVAKTRARCCQACIGSRPWQNAGCSAHTRERWTPRTCPATSMSLCSASTAASHVAAGCCSTESWNSPSHMTQCATRTSRGRQAPRPRSRSRRRNAGILQAWSALDRTGRGGSTTPVKWIPQSHLINHEGVLMLIWPRIALSSLAFLSTLAFGQAATMLRDLDSQGRATLTKEDLGQLLPNASMSRVNADGNAQFWKNDPGGTFTISSGQSTTAQGKWHVSDDGRYCVLIEWKRAPTEEWCR